MLGLAIAYYIGYYGGREFIVKYGRYIHLNENWLVATEKWFERHGAMAIFGHQVAAGREDVHLGAGGDREIQVLAVHHAIGNWVLHLVLSRIHRLCPRTGMEGHRIISNTYLIVLVRLVCSGQFFPGVYLAPVRFPVLVAHGREGITVGKAHRGQVKLGQRDAQLAAIDIPGFDPLAGAQDKVVRPYPPRTAAFSREKLADPVFQLAADGQVIGRAPAGEAVPVLADAFLDRLGFGKRIGPRGS